MRDPQGEFQGGDQHAYVSTACLHGECGSCRRSCKYCDAVCLHDCHESAGPQPAAWVDQARGIARDLLDAFRRDDMSHELAVRIEQDPDLFWLRGGETPPGERA